MNLNATIMNFNATLMNFVATTMTLNATTMNFVATFETLNATFEAFGATFETSDATFETIGATMVDNRKAICNKKQTMTACFADVIASDVDFVVIIFTPANSEKFLYGSHFALTELKQYFETFCRSLNNFDITFYSQAKAF